MIDKLIGLSLRYRVIVIALAAAFLVWGGFVLRDVPLDVLPDLRRIAAAIEQDGRTNGHDSGGRARNGSHGNGVAGDVSD